MKNYSIVFILTVLFCCFGFIVIGQRLVFCERLTNNTKSVKEIECLKFLVKAMPNLKNNKPAQVKLLDFSYNRNITGSEFNVLSETPNVIELNCHYAVNLTDTFSKSLKFIRSIKVLILFGTQVTENSIDAITELKDLEMLRLGYIFDNHVSPETWSMPSPFSDQTLVKLKTCSKLKHLYIGEQCTITDQGLRNLTDYKNLEYLGLSTSNVTTEGIEFLKTLAQIKKIDIFLSAKDNAKANASGKTIAIKKIEHKGMCINYEFIKQTK
ncbi:MAG: hypothetical protein LBT09_15330 [Planctomycetaceae bacterium]|jgi:hypothetical protein|nr:hypothetical protein [Planctomycetaceae bacterium]